MKNLYHSLLLIAGSTQKQLASQIRYLKIENQILRSKLPARVNVTEQERTSLRGSSEIHPTSAWQDQLRLTPQHNRKPKASSRINGLTQSRTKH